MATGVSAAVAQQRFDAGRACLNLLATVGQRGADSPVERVPDTDALASWLVAAGLCDDPPDVNAEQLTAMRSLRAATWDVLAALRAGQRAPAEQRAVINAHAAWPIAVPRLTGDGRRVRSSASPVESALAVLARDAIDIATGPDLARLRECADPTCRMLFLDTSRSGQRRWCSMARCGNRAKARNHAIRSRHATHP